uniref:Uncharacterized protein n=1 Tax=Xiphophorus maculatus TaxID=8083 RepID=A0A3B5R7I6_XIPMA
RLVKKGRKKEERELQQIEREVRMQEREPTKLLATCSQRDQALEAPKSLLTRNARILALLGQLQRMRRAQILGGEREGHGSVEAQGLSVCMFSLEDLRIPLIEPTHAQGEHANSVQKDPRPGFEPRTFLLQGNSATNCVPVQPSDEAGPGFSRRVEIYSCCGAEDFPPAAPAPRRMIFLGGSFSNCWDARKKIRAAAFESVSCVLLQTLIYNLLAQTTLTIEHVREGFKTHDLTLSATEDSPFWLPRYGNMCCCLVAQPLCMTRFGFEICKVRMRSMQRCRHVASWVGCSRRTNPLESTSE